MEELRRVLTFLVLFSSLLAAAESPKSLYKKGVKAEAHQDYEQAFAYYKAAHDLKPEDLKFRLPYERVRPLAAASMIKRAQKMRQEGKLQDALVLFEQAGITDPSSDLAIQEIRRTQEMIQKRQAPAGQPSPSPPPDDFLRQRAADAAPPVELGSLSNAPISGLKMTETSRAVYETLGKLAGINVLFDPDYTPRQISIDLQRVTMQQALDIVALESRTFWRPVTPNTIFVAQDTPTKRRELEQQVVKTFYLGNVDNLAGGTELQDIQTALRTILESIKLIQIPSQNALIVKGTPDQLAMAQKIIDDIDKAKPEVLVDVVVAQVLHDKIRNIGILPPQNATIALQGTNTTSSGSTGSTTTTTTSGIPNFNDLQHLNSTNWVLTNLDPVKVQLLLSDSDTKVMQTPRIRASDGEKAQLKIIDRIPIATGSFGTPLGITGAVGALGVNTQFQYTDVGVTLEITPRVHPDGEITLKMVLEISNQNGSSPPIGGISQPIISTRHAEETIRLKDGEMNMLGGILENAETMSNAGLPFLRDLPVLKYFFSQENKEVRTSELVFLLVPHIIRGEEYSELNQRPIDVGTGAVGGSIDLRMMPNPQASPATGGPSLSPAAAPVQPVQRPQPAAPQPPVAVPPQPQPMQSQPPAQPSQAAAETPQANAGAQGSMAFRIDPPQVAPAAGSSFALGVILSNGQDVYSVPIQVTYDSRMLEFANVNNGGFLSKDGQTVALVHRDDPSTGTLQITAQRPPGLQGVSGTGTVFSIVFNAKAKGQSIITVMSPGVRNSQNQPLQAAPAQASVTVN